MKGVVPPAEWLLSQLLEEFPGCTPAQVKEMDVEELLMIRSLRQYARAKRAIDDMPDDATESDLKKWGMSEDLISQVMANYERQMAEGHDG